MIFYRNYHRKLQNKQEEIEAIRQCNGKDVTGGDEFRLIELVLKKTCISPEKRHGFQDTDITHEQDGSVVIAHRAAGSGMLRFDPNNYGNPMGFLAKTQHNIEQLAKCYAAGKDWTFMDKGIEDEVKKLAEKHLKSMSERDRKTMDLMAEQAKQDRFSVAPDIVPEQPVKIDGTNRVLQEMAEMRAENERLRNENSALKVPAAPVSGVTPAKPTEAPPIPDVEDTGPDPWVITAKNGTIYDFNAIPNFDVRKLAKVYNVPYDRAITKEKLVPLVMDAIEKELEAVPEAAPAIQT